MRKILSLLILACVLLCGFILPGFAENEAASASLAGQDTSATSGVDVVVVLDASNSMRMTDSSNNITGGSDTENYRLDATAMLIGMLDMDTSRVAVVPFNKTIVMDKDGELMHLTAVDNTVTRRNLIEKVYEVGAKLDGGTDYGTALLKAIEILEGEKDQTGKYKDNQPMIVLMTDGYNDMDNITGFNTTSQANAATDQAVQKARESGIPIYTVVLGESKSQNESGGKSMEQISVESGAGKEGSQGTASDVNRLPSFFAQMLAKRIGSSTTFKATDGLENPSSDLYRIRLPLVNNSIREANIIIPIKTRGGNNALSRNTIIESIKIYKGDEEVRPYYKYDAKGHFAIIKITDIQGGDDWALEYKNGGNPGADVSLLYNYNIKLNAEAAIRNNPDQREEVFKDDVLVISAYFIDLATNKPSADQQLYAKHPDDSAWGTIQAYYTIVNSDGEVITDGAEGIRLEAADSLDKYTGEVDLEAYRAAGKLPAGTYTVNITAKGAGLERSAKIDFTVTNRAPEATAAVEKGVYTHSDIKVNKTTEIQADGESWGMIRKMLGEETGDGAAALLAQDLITDPDKDSLSFALEQTSGADVLNLEKKTDENGLVRIQFTTVQEDGERKNRSGDASARLTATDTDGGQAVVDIAVKVVSLSDDFWGAYEIRLIAAPADQTDPKDQDTFKKHQDIVLWAFLVDDAGEDATAQEIATVAPQLEIIRPKKVGAETDPVEFQPLETDGNFPGRYRFAANTGGEKTEWTITVTCGEKQLVRTIKIPNDAAPVVKADVPQDSLVLKCNGKWALSFLGSLVGDDTPNRDMITGNDIENQDDRQYMVIDTKDIFGDADGDELSISAPKFYEPGTDNELPENMISAKQVGGHYEVEFSGDGTGIWNAEYKAEMRITATDEDGEKTTYTRIVKVQHLHNLFWGWALIIAIVIIVLVILFLIIHQIRKPRFPMLNLTLREEPSLFNSGTATLSPVKTPTNINAMGVDSDMAARHNISMELLQNIIVKPIRSTVSVGVSVKKMIGGHEVTLADVKMKPKKQYTWKLEQELMVRNMNGEGMIAVKLEDRSGENEAEDIMNTFGGEDGWSDSDFSSEKVSYKDGKHSKKVAKKNMPAEEDNFQGNGDDFDF